MKCTSTFVEKRTKRFKHRNNAKSHLHFRGEKIAFFKACFNVPEPPPLLWRKVTFFIWKHHFAGATSTSVEKKVSRIIYNSWDSQCHLHMRGVNHVKENSSSPVAEQPPHAWRKILYLLSKDLMRIELPPHAWSKVFMDRKDKVIESHLHLRGVQTKRDKQACDCLSLHIYYRPIK